MKLAIERVLVCECVIDKKNVCDYILFADAKTCPLLKEYAISYFLLYANEIMKSDRSKNLRESGHLMSEIVILLTGQDEDDISVNSLRKELSRMKLDVDGSKEAMICRLEKLKQFFRDLNHNGDDSIRGLLVEEAQHQTTE